MTDNSMQGYLAIGQVLRPQGLKGSVKVRPDTDDPDNFLRLSRVYLTSQDGQPLPIDITDVSVRGPAVYLTLGGDKSQEDAELRRNLFLFVPRQEAAALSEFENYLSDLVGCEVVSDKDGPIGVLTQVLQPGGTDVYVVKTQAGNLMFPALRSVISQVDIPNKRIMVLDERLQEVSIYDH